MVQHSRIFSKKTKWIFLYISTHVVPLWSFRIHMWTFPLRSAITASKKSVSSTHFSFLSLPKNARLMLRIQVSVSGLKIFYAEIFMVEPCRFRFHMSFELIQLFEMLANLNGRNFLFLRTDIWIFFAYISVFLKFPPWCALLPCYFLCNLTVSESMSTFGITTQFSKEAFVFSC